MTDIIEEFCIFAQNQCINIINGNNMSEEYHDGSPTLDEDCVVTESGTVFYDIWEQEQIIEED